ncbi:molybdenum cofactor guanylyltransferase [Acuticoccus kandeliae]|uniref:molybdenum cofactor guanylyltransferase n=1 Tax=Acuticoccus kandeliae TaxID=2073160 RepID=UPI0013007A36|nr:NTP transferase domain-containing protein [Acuticoccus kandeliae]
MTSFAPGPTDGAIFCGGEGARIGGGKALRLLGDRPLLAWVILALAPQVTRIGIVARTVDDSRTLIAAVQPHLPGLVAARLEAWADRPGLEGPVAALLGAADRCMAPYLLTSATDTPFLPADLRSRLARTLSVRGAAIAADDRPIPTISLCQRARLVGLPAQKSLNATLAPLAPGTARLSAVEAHNINTMEDLCAAERILATRQTLTRGGNRG